MPSLLALSLAVLLPSASALNAAKPNDSYIPFTIHVPRKAPYFDLNEGIVRNLREENCDLVAMELTGNQWRTSPNFALQHNTVQSIRTNRSECSWKPSYLLAIAKNCTGTEPDGENGLKVQINFQETNEMSPAFHQPKYVAKYVEGSEPENIVKVSASDVDCVNNHQPCDYRILENVPFTINSDGFIKPSRVIYRKEGKNQYVFKVEAIDCFDNSTSVPAEVSIGIETQCVPSIVAKLGSEGDSRRFPFKDLDVNLCPHCQLEDIMLNFELNFEDSSKNLCEKPECDSDSYAVKLLNDYDSTFVENRPPFKRSEYSFNGYDGVLNIDNLAEVNHMSELSFWMKSQNPSFTSNKQQILCKSDKHQMNRHHFSVYIHENKLKMLLRHDPQPQPANHEFFPSRWEWNISNISSMYWSFFQFKIDDDWQTVRLFVNGSENKIATENTVNSLPLEPLVTGSNGQNDDTISGIGACWHGRSQRWSQYFQGKLGKLEIRLRKMRDSSCRRKCFERFEDAHRIIEMRTWEIAFNENSTIAIIRAQYLNQLRHALQKLEYVADKTKNVSETFVNITGAIVCKDMPKQILPSVYMILKSRRVARILDELRIVRSSRLHHFQPFANITILPVILKRLKSVEQCTIKVDPSPAEIDEVYLLNVPDAKVHREQDGSFVFKGTDDKDIHAVLNNIVYVSVGQLAATSKRFDLSCLSKDRGQLFHSIMIENSHHGKIVRRSLGDNLEDRLVKINDNMTDLLLTKGGVMLFIGLGLLLVCSLLAYVFNTLPGRTNMALARKDDVEMRTLSHKYSPVSNIA